MKLEERALLVKLTISNWTANKTDKDATDDVIEKNNADSGAGRFSKRLFGKKALSNISKTVGQARVVHRTLTLPWEDNGNRIITTEGYDFYAKEMRRYKGIMEDYVREFVTNYKEYKKQAREELGRLYHEEDYPEADEVAAKFDFDVEPTPIPVSHDFRAKVSNKEAAAIVKDIEKRQQARLDAAMKDVWGRIADVTEKLAEKLANYKPKEGLRSAEGIFKDTLVTNVKDLADILPSLNINNDPELKRLHKSIVDQLIMFDVDELRGDVKKRQQVAKAAAAINRKVAKFL